MSKKNTLKPSAVEAAVNAVAVNKEAVVNNVITLTVEELDARIAAAIAASQTAVATQPAPVIRQVKPAEDRGAVKAIRFLQRGFNSSVDVTTTKVIAPVAIYVEDSLVPDALHVTSTSTGWLSKKLEGISKASEAKSKALRPAVDPNNPVAILNAMSKDELVAFVASRLNQ